MVVDFVMGKASGFRAVTSALTSEQYSDARVRKEFGRLAAWAKKNGIRTGKWYWITPNKNRMRLAIEVKGKARSSGGFEVRTFPASRVVQIRFNPDEISPRVVYFGLGNFLRNKRKEHKVKSVGSWREVYSGDPWADRKAWTNLTIEAVVRT
jgi:hypothetical protein